MTLICRQCDDSPSARFVTSWWRHQMETFSSSLALCAGNSPVTGEVPSQRPVTRSFDVFFYLRLNIRLNKQLWSWWFETPSCSLWRHCNKEHNYPWYLVKSRSRDSVLKISTSHWFLQEPQWHRWWDVCQIAELSDDCKDLSHGFDISRDLVAGRLTAQWIEFQDFHKDYYCPPVWWNARTHRQYSQEYPYLYHLNKKIQSTSNAIYFD